MTVEGNCNFGAADQFRDQLIGTFTELREKGQFADVTLVSEDQARIPVHQVVLSSCSPVLKTLLASNPHTQQLIYLDGLNRTDLVALLDFMYTGQAKIEDENIVQFLSLSKHFALQNIDASFNESFKQNENRKEEVVKVDKSEDEDHFKCDECSFEASFQDDLDTHIFSNLHFDGLMFGCQHCDKQFTQERGLKRHDLQHEKEILQRKKIIICKMCAIRLKGSRNLYHHIRTFHLSQEEPYSCDQCDYKSKNKSYVKEHIKLKHSGVKHECYQCNQNFTYKTSLRKHIKTNHRGIEPIICRQDGCGNIFFQEKNLQVHLQKYHPSKCPESEITGAGRKRNIVCTEDGCSKKLSRKQDLWRHLKESHDFKQLKFEDKIKEVLN